MVAEVEFSLDAREALLYGLQLVDDDDVRMFSINADRAFVTLDLFKDAGVVFFGYMHESSVKVEKQRTLNQQP